MAAIAAASNPRPVNRSACIIIRKRAAATNLAAGLAVYLSAADTVARADKDALATAQAIGVALQTPTAVGQYIDVCVFGEVTGYTVTAGAAVYVLDDGTLTETFDGSDNTANGDLAQGDFATRVGIATNTTTILVNPVPIFTVPLGA